MSEDGKASLLDNLESLCEVTTVGTTTNVQWNFHEFQRQMMDSEKRFILVLAGTQGGKTSAVPAWLFKEIQLRGPGDYLFVTPTFRIMGLGTLNKSEKVFEFSEHGERLLFGDVQDQPTKVFFGHAQDPDSLESATAKAAVLDECGQKKFKLASFEAIMRRRGLSRAKITKILT